MKLVRQKLEFLEKEIQALKNERELDVSDKEALSMLREALKILRSEGKTSVGVIDIRNKIRLPPEQLARLMKVLEEEGIVGSDD